MAKQKITKTKLQEELKKLGKKLPHGYKIVSRKNKPKK